MKPMRQFVAGGVFFGVLVFLGLFSPAVVSAVAEKIATVFVINDAANAIPVNVINQPGPSQFVTLVRLAASGAGYRQQFADGGLDPVDYAVPAGSVLVVTDIDVSFRRDPAQAGTTAFYFLTGSGIRARLQTTLDAEGNGVDRQHLQTGIVFASGLTFADNLTNASFDTVALRGYLANEN